MPPLYSLLHLLLLPAARLLSLEGALYVLMQFFHLQLALAAPSLMPTYPSMTSVPPPFLHHAPRFLSLEGALYVLRQFFQLQLTPNIESPSYTVLQKFKVQNRQCLQCLRRYFVFV